MIESHSGPALLDETRADPRIAELLDAFGVTRTDAGMRMYRARRSGSGGADANPALVQPRGLVPRSWVWGRAPHRRGGGSTVRLD